MAFIVKHFGKFLTIKIDLTKPHTILKIDAL